MTKPVTTLDTRPLEPTSVPRKNFVRRFFSALGPGLITGAADDDPSGKLGLEPRSRRSDGAAHVRLRGGNVRPVGGIMTRRFWWLISASLMLTACSSVRSGVRVTHNPREVSMCRYLGDVSSRKGLSDLKRRAHALDANVVFLVAESISVRNAEREIGGQAYRCPGRGEIR